MPPQVFANQPHTAVIAGGTTAPAAGTTETWAVASAAAFPSPVTGVTHFHACDPAAPSEIIAVTGVSGAAWTVTRGSESTVPVAHAAGFTVYQVTTSGFRNAVLVPSGTATAGYIPVATGTGSATAWTTPSTYSVSPVGLSTSGVLVANNGAMFGPDTPGTVTCGIQEAINYVIESVLAGEAGYDIVLRPGTFTLSQFTNTTYRIAVAIDAGYDISSGPPVSVTIRGTGFGHTAPEGTGYTPGYPLGCTVIDASGLDSLAQGLYKQGRVFGVVPRICSGTGFGAVQPLNAVQLRMENMVVVIPTYTIYGTGSPAYSFTGTNMSLFVPGNTAPANSNHWQFVNGIDAFAASSFKVKDVCVLSAIAAFNPAGNQYAGTAGVTSYGSAAGFVFPDDANQANCLFETIASYDMHIGLMASTHTSGSQYYSQAASHVLYYRAGGHGVWIGRLLSQSCGTLVQHKLLPKLGTSLSGQPYSDPVGDMYVTGKTFPTAASAGSLHIEEVSIEASMVTLLLDDPANPLTWVANVDHTGTVPAANFGAGANLVVNVTDASLFGLTTLNGTTAGSVTYSQSGVVPWDKRFVAYLAGYENTSGVAQAVTFMTPYNHVPATMKDDTAAATVTATTLTLPASMSAPVTGYIILGGY